jgi:hypothetical protein
LKILIDIDKIVESMKRQIDSFACAKGEQDILRAGVKKAQERIAEIDNSAVQPIPGNIALPGHLPRHPHRTPGHR